MEEGSPEEGSPEEGSPEEGSPEGSPEEGLPDRSWWLTPSQTAFTASGSSRSGTSGRTCLSVGTRVSESIMVPVGTKISTTWHPQRGARARHGTARGRGHPCRWPQRPHLPGAWQVASGTGARRHNAHQRVHSWPQRARVPAVRARCRRATAA
jgi:hypothetical protein